MPTDAQRRALLDLIGFRPTSPEQIAVLQSRDWENRSLRQEMTTGGIQAGKSFITAAKIFSLIPWVEEGWLIGPDFDQCRPEMTYLARWLMETGNLDPSRTSMPNGGDRWIIQTYTGAMIKTFSAVTTAKIAGSSPDLVVMVEAGQCSEDAYLTAKMRAIPKRNAGRGWLWLIGTLEGSTNWFARLFRRWSAPNPDQARAFVLPAWTNVHQYPGGRHDPEILRAEQTLPEALFKEKFAGIPTPPAGLVLREFDAEPGLHVRPIRFGTPPEASDGYTIWLPKDTPLQLWIDPGWNPSVYAVVAAALVDGRVYLVDELYHRLVLDKDIIQLCLAKPWWPQVTHAVMDIAGKQHGQGSTPTRDVWKGPVAAGGAGLPVFGRKVFVQEGIRWIHQALKPDPLTGQPGLIVDPRCKWTRWEATEGWRNPTNGAGDVLSDDPIAKDDHAWKAISYGLVQYFDPLGRQRARPRAVVRHKTAWARSS